MTLQFEVALSSYEFATPVPLPKGTRITMECVHDNSADNPFNVNQPPQRVVYGEQTTNEMAAVLLSTLSVAQTEPRPDVRQEVLAALRRFDHDGDRKLDANELRVIPEAAKLDVAATLRRFDKDTDGKLDVVELIEAVRTLRK